MIKQKLVLKTFVVLFSAFILNACGGGSSDSDSTYDLSEYLFNSAITVPNGEFNYIEKAFFKETGEQVFLFDSPASFTSNDTGLITGIIADNLSILDFLRTYKINAEDIEETDGVLVSYYTRFVGVGTNYYNATFREEIVRNCVLLEHLDTFNLGTATGNLNLTSGVYNDVLKVECTTSTLSDENLISYSYRTYYAKDQGVIFKEGEEDYVIYEF